MFKPNVQKLKAKRDVDGLLRALRWGNGWDQGARDVRRSAAKALGELADARAAEPLVFYAGYEATHWNSSARWVVSDALARMGSAAIEPLAKACELGSGPTKEMAALTLARIGDKRGVAPLVNCLLSERTPHNPPAHIVVMGAALVHLLEKVGGDDEAASALARFGDRFAKNRDWVKRYGVPLPEDVVDHLGRA